MVRHCPAHCEPVPRAADCTPAARLRPLHHRSATRRLLVVWGAAAALTASACGREPPAGALSPIPPSQDSVSEDTATLDLGSEYHAVFLINGQGLIAKIQSVDGAFLVLTDAYYVQTRVDPATKRSSNFLVKRGNEWHGPERMFLNRQHVVLIEPVSATSSAAQTIERMSKQTDTPAR